MGLEEDAKEGKTIDAGQADEQRSILRLSEISLQLDTYDDIFSDFDPRPYSERALSDDFLFEAKRASKEKTSGKIQLRFMIPKDLRDTNLETTIRRRLHEHFRKHLVAVDEDIKRGRNGGVRYISAGVVMMFIASYLMSLGSRDFFFNLLTVILEPCGWFFTWTGLDLALVSYRHKTPDLEFYTKMSKCEITLNPY